MALVVIKTSTANGYCECICGCYELASVRDEDSGKGFCQRCSKEHLEWNQGVGLPRIPPAKVEATDRLTVIPASMPAPADPPGRLR
jgi:hypothetical protein